MNQSDETKLAIFQRDLTYIKEKLDDVDQKVSTHYVSKDEFEPIKKIVYGLVSLILVGVVGALLAIVVNSGVK